nr:parathyroid hormone/parathyroid hormone-related peptide receptor-like isoform X2 [Cherax quadricarinatus]
MLRPGHLAALLSAVTLMVTSAENGNIPQGDTVVDGWPSWYTSQELAWENPGAGRGKQQQKQVPGLLFSHEDPDSLLHVDDGLDLSLPVDEGPDLYAADEAPGLYTAEGGPEPEAAAIIDSSFYDVINSSVSVYNDSWSDHQKKRWLQLMFLQREEECLRQHLLEVNTTSRLYQEGLWCPRVWDRMLCWGPTAPNTTITLPCPDYVPGIITEAHASRRCGENGSWVGGGQERGWTNYTPCLGYAAPTNVTTTFSVIMEYLPSLKQVSMIGYSVSLATLVISFTILASLRKLRCPRNLLHLHLFGSFMLRALVVLVKNSSYVESVEQTWMCKVMICVWQYFILANYSWLLMEGLYLHSLIFMALFTDSSAITLYVLLGWGLPLGCVGIWATLRASLDDTNCWTVHNIQWIFWVCIRAPVAISNLINFFFFLNVVRVLILKLRSSISTESMKYRKLGKSTLVLVPLFGVHYFVLWGLSTSTNAYVELAWLFLDQVFASFQGFFVAVLYCLMNGEVRQELRKLYSRLYKGDMLVVNSHSTLVSQTKTYASRGRTSLHSIHSQAERRDRQTPSPQMPRSEGGDGSNSRPRTPSPSPTPTLTPSYVSRQQSRDMSMEQGSTESYDEAIELQPCTASDGTQHQKIVVQESSFEDPVYSPSYLSTVKSASVEVSTVRNTSESTPVEILIDFHDESCNFLEDTNLKNVEISPKSNGPVSSQNGQVNGRMKEKHLTFSESTEQFLSTKTSPSKENGSIISGSKNSNEDAIKGVICVNVNKNSLKSTTPLQVDSHVIKKSSKGKEQETML